MNMDRLEKLAPPRHLIPVLFLSPEGYSRWPTLHGRANRMMLFFFGALVRGGSRQDECL
ncbi:Uncharacterised protein [Mycobacteroides abscessus]|nr:Uncharacterised protein [Mycobacteroides abscessus]